MKKTICDYKKANFDAINRELSEFTDVFLTDFNNRSVQSNWDMFAAEVHRLTVKHIPTYTIASHSQSPWYNTTIKRLSNKKKRLYRSAKRSPTNERWAAYNTASSIYVRALKQAKDNFVSNVLPSMLKTNVKKFWRVINPPKDNYILLQDSSGDTVPINQCATALNNTFAAQFTKTSDVPLPSTFCYNHLPCHQF